MEDCMLTLRECLDFSGLSEEEIQVIAEHEGLPEIAAAAMGSALLDSEEAIGEIKRLLRTELRSANRHGRSTKAGRLQTMLDGLDQRTEED
jgi:hypothetical protein